MSDKLTSSIEKMRGLVIRTLWALASEIERQTSWIWERSLVRAAFWRSRGIAVGSGEESTVALEWLASAAGVVALSVEIGIRIVLCRVQHEISR